MADDPKSGLEQFLAKRIEDAAEERKRFLELKWKANLNAVTNQDSRVTRWKSKEGDEEWQSTTYIGLTKAKVWTLYAIILDTALQRGQVPFILKPSPHEREPLGEAEISSRDKNMNKMGDKIREQFADRHSDREYMNKFLSLAYYGMTFSKFNVAPVTRRGFSPTNYAEPGLPEAEAQEFTRHEYYEYEEQVPGFEYRSVWDIWWDFEADKFEEGWGVIEREMLSLFELNAKKGTVGYLDDRVDVVIKERKDNKLSDEDSLRPGLRHIKTRTKDIDAREYWGRAPVQLVEDFEKHDIGKKGGGESQISLEEWNESDETGDEVEIIATMINGKCVRFLRSPDGYRPYKKCVLESELDSTTGTGVADNLEDVQYSLNGMVRAFEDNKKLSANVITAVKKRYFANPKQGEKLHPGMQVDISDECPDVRHAILPIVIPDVGETLISGIERMERWGDTVSLLPNILQGFVLPKHTPDTAFEMNQLQENAGKYVGQCMRNIDEMLIEPEVWDIYVYNMRDPNRDEEGNVLDQTLEEAKGNYVPHAQGFTGFQNKVIRGQKIKEILAMVLSAEQLAIEAKVRPHLEVIYRSYDADPDEFLKSPEEKEQELQDEATRQEKAKQEAILALKAEKDLEDANAEKDFQRDVIKEGVKAAVNQ